MLMLKMGVINDVDRVGILCKSLEPVIGSIKTKSLWNTYLASDWKARKELEEYIQMICAKILNKSPGENKILLNPPSEEAAAGDIKLGQIVYNDKELYPLFLKKDELCKHIVVAATTGTGKSNFAFNMILQLLDKNIDFMAIDWKREYRQLYSVDKKHCPNKENILIYTIGRSVVPFCWNPFRPPPGVNYKSWLSIICEVLEKSHISGQGVAYIFTKIYEKKYKEMGFDSDNPKHFPNFYDGLQELETERIRSYGREKEWKQSAVRILKSFTFGPHAICFNSRNPIHLEDLLNKPVIIELDQELPKNLRVFLNELFLRFIHLTRLSQGQSSSLKHVLILEEAHNIFPKNKYENETTNSIENIYREIRSFGQGLIAISQHPNNLPYYVVGNSHTQVYMALQHQDDIYAAKKALFLEDNQQAYLDKLRIGESLIKIKGRTPTCLVRTPLVPLNRAIEITDDYIKGIMKQKGYLTYLKPNSYKNEGTEPIYQGDSRDDIAGIKDFMLDIEKNPVSTTTERYRTLNLNHNTGNWLKNKLLQEGLVKSKDIFTKKGRIVLYDLTPKGREYLRNNNCFVAQNVDGIEHRFWKLKIAEFYKSKGYEVVVEQIVNGRPDICIKKSDNKIAVEIETGNSDPLRNITRNMGSGINTIVVATNKETENSIRAMLMKENLFNDPRVILTNTSSFEEVI